MKDGGYKDFEFFSATDAEGHASTLSVDSGFDGTFGFEVEFVDDEMEGVQTATGYVVLSQRQAKKLAKRILKKIEARS